MKERILLTGKNGQLGYELQRTLAPLGEVVAVDVEECNLAAEDEVRALVRSVGPRIIVNPAAYTAVDKAEAEPGQAFAINTRAPGILAEEAARCGAWLVHYSTDYVFDGKMARPYLETDASIPLSVYGCSKRDGELAVQAALPQHLILRTSWVMGAHGGNFAKTMLRLAAERSSLSVVADQVGAPTSAALLAELTAQLIRQEQEEGGEGFPFGLYHVTASGETSWCDYARFVIAEAVAAGQVLKLAPSDVHPISAADYPLPAPRPANSRLDTRKFRNTFGLPLPHWKVGVGQVLEQLFTMRDSA